MNQPANPWINRKDLALLTDFYQLTMLSGYIKHGLADKDVAFEYFFRTLPPHTAMVITAGLEQFIQYLTHLHFTTDDIQYLNRLDVFDNQTLDYLKNLKPALDVMAVPEGTPVFPHEPIIRITGPLAQAQLVETFLLNALNYQSLIATKTMRICQAAQGDPVLEFGLRRAQGPDGGLTGSRAAYIGGAIGTSNVLAGKLFDIPVRGTLGHSWVMSFDSELKAFESFADTFPKNCSLLVDTYNTLKSGVPNAIKVFKDNRHLKPSIRIDSGDLAKLSKAAYQQFKDAGMEEVNIIGTNDLDEDLIADLKRQGAKINLWAVGTHLITSKDHPALDGVYKMVAMNTQDSWQPRIKLSGNPEKATDPGLKQPYRLFNESNQPMADIIFADHEELPQAASFKAKDRLYLHLEKHLEGIKRIQPLMKCYMKKGQVTEELPSIHDIQTYSRTCLKQFPEEYLRLRNPEIYWLGLSPELAKIKENAINNFS